MAEKILGEFGSIPKFFDASDRRLTSLGINNSALKHQICLIKNSLHHYLKPAKFNEEKLENFSDLLSYLIFHHGYLQFEQVRILFFNCKNYLIADQLIASGTPDQAPIFVRNVVHQALDLGASALVIVHNHPGEAKPKASRQDIMITKEICTTCRLLGISVHDHLIISKNRYFSFTQQGLM